MWPLGILAEPSIVKLHVINMLQKTNLENKLQLAIAATEAKLLGRVVRYLNCYFIANRNTREG